MPSLASSASPAPQEALITPGLLGLRWPPHFKVFNFNPFAKSPLSKEISTQAPRQLEYGHPWGAFVLPIMALLKVQRRLAPGLWRRDLLTERGHQHIKQVKQYREQGNVRRVNTKFTQRGTLFFFHSTMSTEQKPLLYCVTSWIINFLRENHWALHPSAPHTELPLAGFS